MTLFELARFGDRTWTFASRYHWTVVEQNLKFEDGWIESSTYDGGSALSGRLTRRSV